MSKNLTVQSNPAVAQKLATYPIKVQKKLEAIRKIILEVAKKSPDIDTIEETLKWGEPSYLVKKGSTIRMDWKEKSPDQYAVYFKCTSKLVPTFKEVYGDLFQYEKNRAIIFQMEDKIPKRELGRCIQAALSYHTVKEKNNLGL